MIAFGAEIERMCAAWGALPRGPESHGVRAEAAMRFLGLFGWSSPDPLTEISDDDAFSFRWRGGEAPTVAAHFVAHGAIDSPKALASRGLDLDPETTSVVRAIYAQGIHYAFITDLHSFFLYDTRSDSPILSANSPAEFIKEFDDVLTDAQLRAGNLTDVRRQPRSSLARQLREWQDRRRDILESEWRAPDHLADLALDRLTVLRYARECGALARPGWNAAARIDHLLEPAAARQTGCGISLVSLFDTLHRQWQAEMFAPVAQLEAILEQDAVAAPLLTECGLLARGKFDAATILESFNFGEAAEKARVRMIPEQNADRHAYLSGQTVETIDEAVIKIDVAEEGYRALIHWLDQLMACYERIAGVYAANGSGRARPSSEMDLFDWSELNEAKPNALRDPWLHAFEHGLVVQYDTPRQFRTARLLLYLHVIERFAETGARLHKFPPVERALSMRQRAGRAAATQIAQPGSLRNAL